MMRFPSVIALSLPLLLLLACAHAQQQEGGGDAVPIATAYSHLYSDYVRVWSCGEHAEVELRAPNEKMSVHNRTVQAHNIDMPIEGLMHPANKHVFEQKVGLTYKDMFPSKHHCGGTKAIAQLSFLLSQRVGRPLLFSPRALSLFVPTRVEEALFCEENKWPRSTRPLHDVLTKMKVKASKIYADSEDELEIVLHNFRRQEINIAVFKGTVFEQAFWTGRALLVATEDQLLNMKPHEEKTIFKVKVTAIPLSAASPQNDHFHVTPFVVAFRRIMGGEEKEERRKIVLRARRIEGLSDPFYGKPDENEEDIDLDTWASYDREAEETFLFRTYTGQLQPLEGEAGGPTAPASDSEEEKENEEDAVGGGHQALFDTPPYFNIFGALHFRPFHHHRTGATPDAVARAAAEDVKMLLLRGDNVLSLDGRRRSALHVAAELDNLLAIDYMMSVRSNYTDIIRQKRTDDPTSSSREHVQASRQQEIASILKEALGDTKIADSIKLNEVGEKKKKQGGGNGGKDEEVDADEARADQEGAEKAAQEEAGDADDVTPVDLLYHEDMDGHLPHHVACLHAHPRSLAKFLTFNSSLASVPVYSNSGRPMRNCLHLAVKASQYEFHLPAILRVLEQLKDHNEREAALEKRIIEVIDIAIQSGASLHLKDSVDGATPLHVAVAKNLLNTVKRMIELGADVTEADRFGLPPLYRAIQHESSPALVGLLLDSGASAVAKVKDGRSSIHWVTGRRSNCDLNLIRILTQKGASIFDVDNKGRTPLHLAAQQGHYDCVKYLVENGADVLAKTKDGKAAYELARGRETIAYLKQLAHSRMEDDEL
eukprot:CAMPEP_0113873924 /NCGR_PEP_ID=MMETSP0780_2-20120614/4044_1 /TAXON_ID=652834 /ORGANISM="Palpitomonas bilix" /LENGTH=824 /DNA_ID=CAMNT_0000859631 /DNA_START=89 /DNA_END=2563 /DNA_ORIENTATION=- /assembly_acc=CAM_ASM_000599